MDKTAKRSNRRKLITIQAYIIAVLFVLFGMMIGLVIGILTTPVETITLTKTIKVSSHSSDNIPEVEDVYYYDVPLSHSLQRFIYEVCEDEKVPVALVMAMIEYESQFNPEIVSSTDDYGLMQINSINHKQLKEKYRTANMLDPYQNVYCGIKIIGSYIEKYTDYGNALMAYNMGEYGAKKAWENGVQSTSYSTTILELMSEYEKEVSDNA